jgi:hypothetical protein
MPTPAKYIIITSFTRLAAFACLLSMAFPAVAQDTVRHRFAIEASYGRAGIQNGYLLSLVYRHRHHGFHAGAAIMYPYGSPAPAQGIQAGYSWYPLAVQRRVNLLFTFQTSLLRYELNNSHRMFFHSGEFVQVHEREFNVMQDNFFCFGFIWRVARWLNLRMSYGPGISFYKQDYTYRFSDGGYFQATGPLAPRKFSLENRLFQLAIQIRVAGARTKRK